ncbi:replication initiation protein [bacterium endosymbiont of Bathymodiolus sp. 5 South]|jgi:plasmid replication initiation protein|uniref:replication initiation protein n=1 Tax=bacterium endosymbiont of Bathymodiolus sp. 5 South TaxID=1181670 RepID=UPI0010B35E53|nr:replication initiation protein [bacterium endosymbiont of Bathymodiolus sp. 5 South]CAC9639695.1 hypothetical protein [uncultured Gammaproteobacteria bacterium]SHN93717.1 hypothetical protein BCLUESOX_953 [bacterium endosymbiont of Bathymodiolus sp. 5 South]SSC08415.1 hypothetical protein BTURTLESOX_1803 [bacterium endosymbiont of Bathymodiolus sp. 5 South]VVH56105.1 hypothetical protein BSPCLSOX_2575 [uncultured Gammaproteobacteria bacterium]VVM23364.1 hypothetical protein BSPWISOXPB_3525 
MKQKNKITEIKKSNALINAFYNMSVDTYKIFSLAASKFKDQLYFQKDITQDQNIFRVVIDREEVENIFPSFKNNKLIKKRLNKVAQETKANSAIAIPIIEGDEVGFRFIPIIDSIKYNHIKQQIIMIFRPEAKEHLNPDPEKGNFDLDDVKNLGFITSMKQVPIYNICHKNINLGSVKRSIEELRKLTNTPEDKFQQTGHFINRVIKYQVNVINKNSILTIEVALIKTGRKITHINFIISKKGTHPIEEINQKPNSINKQLTNLGFHGDKLQSFLKIPTEVLLLSINATQKEKIKGFHTTTMRGFFFSRVQRLSKNTNTKITPLEIVQLFKDNLHIIEGRELWQEFYAQLNIKQQETYSNGNKDKNKLVKQALDNDFTNKFNKWIYETKIKQ